MLLVLGADMPLVRYIKLVALSALGEGDLEVSGLRAFTVEGDLYTPGTVSCLFPPKEGTLSDLSDLDPTNTCTWGPEELAFSGFSITLDLGAVVLADYLQVLPGASREKSPRLYGVSTSVDQVSWVFAAYGSLLWTAPYAGMLGTLDAGISLCVSLLSGSTFTDGSPYSKNFAPSGGATLGGGGAFGPGVVFDGSGVLTSQVGPVLAPGTLDFCLESFIRPTDRGTYYGDHLQAGSLMGVASTLSIIATCGCIGLGAGEGEQYSGNGGFGGQGDCSTYGYPSVQAGRQGHHGLLGVGGDGAAQPVGGYGLGYAGGGGGAGGGGYYGGGGGGSSGGWWGNDGGAGGGGSNYSEGLVNRVSKRGNESFLSPAGVLGTGHSSDGFARVTNLRTLTITNFPYLGYAQSLTVPSTDNYRLEVWGAQGGYLTYSTLAGGKGGYASGELQLIANEVLVILVGGRGSPTVGAVASGVQTSPAGGFNGGGNGGGSGSESGGSGGGGTDIRRGGDTLPSRILVAGGGAGGGGVGSGGYSGRKSHRVAGGAGVDGQSAQTPPPGFSFMFDASRGTTYAYFSDGVSEARVVRDNTLAPWDYTKSTHVAVSRYGNTASMYRGGVNVGNTDVTGMRIPVGQGNQLSIGVASFSSATSARFAGLHIGYFTGVIDNCRMLIGLPFYTADFVPTLRPFPSGSSSTEVLGVKSALNYCITGNESLNLTTDLRVYQADTVNVLYGGVGSISGTVKEVNPLGPINTPLSRRVRLIWEVDGSVVTEVWSDPVTGDYSFTGLSLTEKFTTIAHDLNQHYRAVVSSHLTPENTL